MLFKSILEKETIRLLPALLLLIFSIQISSGQQDSIIFEEIVLKNVEGTVVGAKNQPLEDVAVSVEGVNASPVLTDENGRFNVVYNTLYDWIIINPTSHYKSKRVFLNGRENLVISLTEIGMPSGYDEVTINNITDKRRDKISSNAIINSEELQNTKIVSADQTLQQNVSGVMSTSHSGMPGLGTVNYIGGIKSVSTSNTPLYIVDGVPIESPGLIESAIAGNVQNPLTSINPLDISEIVVLKDPLSTAIYGSNGSNGVILINTLVPKALKTTIDFSFKTGLNFTPERLIPQLNNNQYKSLASEILTGSPQFEENFEEDYPGLYKSSGEDDYYKYMHNTNWQKQIFENSLLTEAYLSIKGSTDLIKYGLSAGYHDQGGIIKNSGLRRFTVRFVSDVDLFKWLNLNLNASLASIQTNIFPSAHELQTNPVYTALSKPPIMGPYRFDEEGQQLTFFDEVDELGTSNPLAVVEGFKGENQNYRFVSSVSGNATITENIKFHTLLGINLNNMSESVFMPNIGVDYYRGGEAHNISVGTNNYYYAFYNNSFLNYINRIDNNNELQVSLGIRLHQNSFNLDILEAANLNESDEYTELQGGEIELRKIGGKNEEWNWLNVYNRINYKLKDKYIVSASLSTDFSSLTGKEANTPIKISGQPFGLFYSIGGGWRISQEDLLKNIRGLDNLMLRASYGLTGNNDIGLYNSYNYYSLSWYRETSTLVPGLIPSRDLIFEKLNQFTGGVDLSLWGNRTSLTIEYFNKRTFDVMVYEPVSTYVGTDVKPDNKGEIENTGFDIFLFHRLMDGRNFDLDVSTNVTFLNNSVVGLEGKEIITAFEGGEFITQSGLPVISFYGYQFDGIYTTTQEALNANMQNSSGQNFRAGDVRFVDISGPDNSPDGVIDDYDKTNIGSPVPEFFGSASGKIRYKRWSLNGVVKFVYGNELFNYVRYLNERMTDLSNQSTTVLNRWQFEGHETAIPRALWNDPIRNSSFSSRWIEDGSFIRLKSVTLAYTIPSELLFLRNARFYVTANNLFTAHNYTGYDPEFSFSHDVLNQGIDYGLMPNFRSFMLGINIGL